MSKKELTDRIIIETIEKTNKERVYRDVKLLRDDVFNILRSEGFRLTRNRKNKISKMIDEYGYLGKSKEIYSVKKNIKEFYKKSKEKKYMKFVRKRKIEIAGLMITIVLSVVLFSIDYYVGSEQNLQMKEFIEKTIQDEIQKVDQAPDFEKTLKEKYGITKEQLESYLDYINTESQDIYEKGLAALITNNYEEALDYFNQLIEIDSMNYEAHLHRGDALFYLGEYMEAIEAYAVIPRGDNEMYTAALLNKGLSYSVLGMFEKSIECYDEILETLDPADVGALTNKGVALDQLGRHEKARECYDQALSLDQNNPVIWNNKGNSLRESGEPDKALQCFDKAIELDENHASAYYNKGLALENMGKHGEAIDNFNRALALYPDHYKSWHRMGISYKELENYEKALDCYERALKINPSGFRILVSKGIALSIMGRYEEALQTFDEAIEISPEFADAWYNKGYLLFTLKDYSNSIVCFEKTTMYDKTYFKAWKYKGIALYYLGEYEEALESLKKALELDPDNQEVLEWIERCESHSLFWFSSTPKMEISTS